MIDRPTPETTNAVERIKGDCSILLTNEITELAKVCGRIERERDELMEAMNALLEHKPRHDWGGLTIAERLAWDNAKDAIDAVKEGKP